MSERLSERTRRERADILARETARAVGEQGCFRLRVDEVARAAGVGKGTVYLDYRDKASLVGASLTCLGREMLDELGQRLESLSAPGERLREAVRFLARLPLDRPDLLVLLERRLLCAAQWIGADVSPYAEIERYFAVLVEDARRAGSLESDVDPHFAAEAILAVASTPAWRGAAAEEGSDHAEHQLARLMPVLRIEPGADQGT